MVKDENIDYKVIESFGFEWNRYSYRESQDINFLDSQFRAYSVPINLNHFNSKSSIAVDIGAGSGRWAERLSPYFRKIIALEPSKEAIQVLHSRFANNPQFQILNESANSNSLSNHSIDLIMSLGVLHHLPDPKSAIKYLSKKLKSGGWFWCYLYYNLENKSRVYRLVFKMSNFIRLIISNFPNRVKIVITSFIAFVLYLPLARLCKLLSNLGLEVSHIPLHHYKEMPLKVILNDAYDRFATRIEHRFSKNQIIEILQECDFDLDTLTFSESEPFYTFAIRKA